MTFFNKKTEVMQIEMTPYGRYLYSIGKFKPHSYEFVDDDVLYRASGSTETQEAAHARITNETPKLKINRAFQDEAPQQEAPPTIDKKRLMQKKQDLRQTDTFVLGRSSYSSDMLPHFQLTMIKGEISGSKLSEDVSLSGLLNQSGAIFIPQVDIDFKLIVELKDEIVDPIFDMDMASSIFENGEYLSLSYDEPIIHLKEFNSFYEKENFEIEIFEVSGSTLIPKKQRIKPSSIVENMVLTDDGLVFPEYLQQEFLDGDTGDPTSDFSEYFFDIEVDREIPVEILCERIQTLEINNQFIDEELICPDVRTDSFNIYSTNIKPDDLENC
tara:strand:- start:3197 stop:4180 length:984 start_codon:yes stop_codon:yes gene_type:complete